MAQSATTQTGGGTAGKQASPPNWTITCSAAGTDAPLRCRLIQEVYVASSKTKVLTLTVIGSPAAGQPPTITLALPHGFHFPAGAVVKIDEGQPLKLDIQSSDQAGVYTGTTLDQPLLDAIKRGIAMTVTIFDSSGKALVIPVKLAGFTAGFNRFLVVK